MKDDKLVNKILAQKMAAYDARSGRSKEEQEAWWETDAGQKMKDVMRVTAMGRALYQRKMSKM
jgi:hypothetical protein